MEMTRKQVQIPRESICPHYYISTIPSQGVQESACVAITSCKKNTLSVGFFPCKLEGIGPYFQG